MSTEIAQINKLVTQAIKDENHDLVKYYLDHTHYDPRTDSNDAIKLASEKGFLKIVKLLLLDERVSPETFYNCAVKLAAKNGHLEVVNVLLKDSRINYDSNELKHLPWISKAIEMASDQEHFEVVQLLKDFIKSKNIIINIPIEFRNIVVIKYI